MLYPILLFLHIIAATIWVGGHFILVTRYLPKALRKNDFSIIHEYEKAYEPIGIPALVLSLITGLWLSYIHENNVMAWFDFSSHFPKHITLKLILLLITIILAIHARFFLIPKHNLKALAYHIVLITFIAILFVLVGVSANTNLLF